MFMVESIVAHFREKCVCELGSLSKLAISTWGKLSYEQWAMSGERWALTHEQWAVTYEKVIQI